MALSLIDPSPSDVIVHDGGLISIRCADFLGAARGTLSTEADALSAAGDVVRDDQTIAVQTSFVSTATRFGLASNTVVITNASIPYEDDIFYKVFLGLRLEGAPPSNARMRDTVHRHASSTGYGLGVGASVGASFFQNVDYINNETCAEYVLRELISSYLPSSTTGDLNIRAWGVTGGTVSILLDTLYLIPTGQLNNPDPGTRWMGQSPNDYEALELHANGVLFRDEDEDDLWWPGKHSVFNWQVPWAPDSMGWGQLVDFQEDDSEPTVADINGDGTWDGSFGGPADPKSYLWILAGGTNIPAVTVITDPFDDTSDSAPPTSPANWTVPIDGYVRQVEVGAQSQVLNFWSLVPQRRGFFVEAGSGLATCYFGDSTGSGGAGSGPSPFGTNVYRAETYWGEDEFAGNTLSQTDPRNFYPRFLRDMECWEQVCKFRMRDNTGRASASLGQFASAASGSVDTMWSAWLQWDGADLDLYLIGSWETSGGFQSAYSGPASISTTYSLDDWYWLRVQRQGYTWRARAWLDGTGEPGTWDLEEQQPILRNPTGTAFVDYPYDDNWVLSVNNDGIIYDPRGGPSGIASDIDGSHAGCGIRCTSDTLQARMRIECDDYQLDWNPGSGTPGDMNVRVDKWDGSATYGSVTVPYGAHRVVAGSLDRYHFNSDTNGINIYAWKDAGQPDFMTAGLGRIFQRAPYFPCRPQIYRLVIF